MSNQDPTYSNSEEREFQKLTKQHWLIFGESLSWHRFAVGLISAGVYVLFDKTDLFGSIILSVAIVFLAVAVASSFINMDIAIGASSDDIDAFIDGIESDAIGMASKKLKWTTWITLSSISLAALCVLFVVIGQVANKFSQDHVEMGAKVNCECGMWSDK